MTGQWIYFPKQEVQYEFVTGFTCAEFMNVLLEITSDMDGITEFHVNQKTYAVMQTNNLIDFIPDRDGNVRVPTFLGRVLETTTAELPIEGVRVLDSVKNVSPNELEVALRKLGPIRIKGELIDYYPETKRATVELDLTDLYQQVEKVLKR